MKKCFLTLLIIFFALYSVKAQYPGYRTSNYTGVNGVFFNPANISDSRYRWDFNLISFDGFIGNNQHGLGLKDVTKSWFNSDSLKNRLLRSNSPNLNSLVSTDIFGPSLMFNASRNTAFAITTRARIFGNARDINGNLSQAILDAGAANNSYPINFTSGSDSRLNIAGWSEIGLSLGQVLTPSGSHHFFKTGLTLKYLAGIANAYLQQSNLRGTIGDGPNGTYLTNTTGTVGLNTTATDFNNYELNDFFKFNGHGFGGDLGLVYEYRPNLDYKQYQDDRFDNKYKIKIGLALLDVGKIKFSKNDNTAAVYTANIPDGQQFLLNQFDGKSVNDYNQILDNSPYFTRNGNNNDPYSISLPTTLHLDIDYHINKGFYVDAGGQFAFNKSKSLNLYAYNIVSITPRYENSIFGVEIPLSYNELTQFNAGVSFRIGPFFIGSGSVFTALFDNSKQADVHAGLRFGIPYKKKIRPDRDNDGVYDDQDQCPDKPGFARYNGCPIPDTDGDGVNDEEDSCVNAAGVARYHGCPIPDTDKDGVNDEEDSCVSVAGLPQFHGCPDTDGDGIPDPKDKCPTVAGVEKYGGCPIPDKDGDGINDDEDLCPNEPGPASTKGCPVQNVVVQITADFKNILFDFGKATIKSESMDILTNAAKTMNEQIPNSNFYIDGYTDNVGSVARNKKLSLQRAQAVADALIAAGGESATGSRQRVWEG